MPPRRLCNSCGRIVTQTERGLGPCCQWIRRVYQSERWRQLRRRVLERDGWRCCAVVDGERCTEHDRPGARLQAHHVTPLRRGGAAFDEANVVSLCDAHHREAERGTVRA